MPLDGYGVLIAAPVGRRRERSADTPHFQMRPLPADTAGPDNDLADLLDHYVTRAITDGRGTLHAFGQRWGPEAQTADKVFGFRPATASTTST